MKPLCRSNGLYQWDAKVSGISPGIDKQRKVVNITVFCDTRADAIEAACHEVGRLGYASLSVNHITKVG